MSIMKDLLSKRFWIGQALTMLVVLAVTALGALLTASGMLAVDKAWVCGCVAWAAAGLFGGRFAGDNGEFALLHGIISILITMGAMWLIGLTTPEQGSGDLLCWPWYVGCGLAGTIMAAALPRKHKKHRRGKGKSKQNRR